MDKKTILLPFFISHTESINDILPTSETDTVIRRGVLLEKRKLDKSTPIYNEHGLVVEDIIYWHPSADSIDIIERGIELVKKGIGLDIKNSEVTKRKETLKKFLNQTKRQ